VQADYLSGIVSPDALPWHCPAMSAATAVTQEDFLPGSAAVRSSSGVSDVETGLYPLQP
jgi:hypothetical protein